MAYVYRTRSTARCICQGGFNDDIYMFRTGTRYSFTEYNQDEQTVISEIKRMYNTNIFYKTQQQLDREMTQSGESNEIP